MPVETFFDPDTGLRIHEVTGPLVLDDVQSALQEIYARPEFDPDASVLWDIRQAEVSGFTAVDVQLLTDFVSQRWGTSGRSRAALVVTEEFQFGMARMFELMLDSRSDSPVQVFRDRDEAIAWLMEE